MPNLSPLAQDLYQALREDDPGGFFAPLKKAVIHDMSEAGAEDEKPFRDGVHIDGNFDFEAIAAKLAAKGWRKA